MGLRINTNTFALTSLRFIRIHENAIGRSLERLSSGLRINRASDDPSGFVIANQLRAQLSALDQATRNTQNATNLLTTIDAALGQIENLLISIQSSVNFALGGGGSPEQIAAEQASVDAAIQSINRIANTTRFAGRPLLNGATSFQLSSAVPPPPGGPADEPAFIDVNVKSLVFSPDSFSRSLDINVSRVPLQPRIRFVAFGDASSATGMTVRITGPRGTADVSFAVASGAGSGATNATAMESAVNSVASTTGVFAEATGTQLDLIGETFGESTIRLEVLATSPGGTYLDLAAAGAQALGVDAADTASFTIPATDSNSALDITLLGAAEDLNTGDVLLASGRQGALSFKGQTFVGSGLKFSINAAGDLIDLKLNPDAFFTAAGVPTGATAGTSSFTVVNTGLIFQLNEGSTEPNKLRLGIAPADASRLGETITVDQIRTNGTGTPTDKGGFLSSVASGGQNDLSTNPANAQFIVNSALNQVTLQRAFVGALVAFTTEPNESVLAAQFENLSQSLSTIRDLDFAQETAELARNQILFQFAISSLASANLVPSFVLRLIEGS